MQYNTPPAMQTFIDQIDTNVFSYSHKERAKRHGFNRSFTDMLFITRQFTPIEVDAFEALLVKSTPNIVIQCMTLAKIGLSWASDLTPVIRIDNEEVPFRVGVDAMYNAISAPNEPSPIQVDAVHESTN